MTQTEIEEIRFHDAKFGDNWTTLFPMALDRRKLLAYVEELKEKLSSLEARLAGHDGQIRT